MPLPVHPVSAGSSNGRVALTAAGNCRASPRRPLPSGTHGTGAGSGPGGTGAGSGPSGVGSRGGRGRPERLCCGLTWISTGQLGMARRMLRRTISALRPALDAGRQIVVLEPSCAAVFRSDAPELLGHKAAAQLAQQTKTLAEILHEARWQPQPQPAQEPDGQAKAIAQVHCHQHAIMGFDADAAVLRACGVDVDVLDTGCCGLAGNFGFERGHYEVSVGCAERGLWPAVSGAEEATTILADGFSCRTQIEAGNLGRKGIHLAQLLARQAGLAEADGS